MEVSLKSVCVQWYMYICRPMIHDLQVINLISDGNLKILGHVTIDRNSAFLVYVNVILNLKVDMCIRLRPIPKEDNLRH